MDNETENVVPDPNAVPERRAFGPCCDKHRAKELELILGETSTSNENDESTDDNFWFCCPRLPCDAGKITVVLDLDETLIATKELSVQIPLSLDEVDDKLDFNIRLEDRVLRVRKRPMLDEFLVRASSKFELFLFTAGTSEYAMKVIQHIDPNRQFFRHIFTREHCTYDGNRYLKDLKLAGRCLRRTVLVDNSSESFMADQLPNGILISSYCSDPDDQQLIAVYHLLRTIENEFDVRHSLVELAKSLATDSTMVDQPKKEE